jgi:hypothetical protein
VTAVPATAAAAPRLAVKAAPTAAPVLRDKSRISTGTIIKNTDLSRFSPTPKFNIKIYFPGLELTQKR